jgi:transposase
MQVVYPVCCGLEVHQAQLTACLRRVSPAGQLTTERRDFGPTYAELLALSAWLMESHCPVVALESTGVYGRPVYHVLAGTVEVLVGHAREMRPRPGKTTDPADATGLAEWLAHGRIRPSFVPPPMISALRALTRTRVALVQTRTHAKNRVHKVLEDTHVKLSSVVTDLCGTSGRRRLAAFIAGERDVTTLAALALGKLRRKLLQLELALAGQFTVHHARLIQGALELIDLLDRQIAELDQQIGELVQPVRPQITQLDSIPGVDETAARDIVAESGTAMSRFGAASRLASWASLCPGHNASAGKRRHGRTRKGNRSVRRVLIPCAWAARKPPTFLGRTFRRLEARLGGKKAAMAVAHKLLVRAYHLLAEGTVDAEQRYAHLQPRQEEQWRRRAVKALERLGYQVV